MCVRVTHLVQQLPEPDGNVALHGVAADGVSGTGGQSGNSVKMMRGREGGREGGGEGGGEGMVLRALQRLRCNVQPTEVHAEERVCVT